MKKLLLSLAAMAALTAGAQTKLPVRIDNYNIMVDADGNETVTVSPGETTYYNAKNEIAFIQSTYARRFYTLDANGNVIQQEAYNWSDQTGWGSPSTTVNEYDAEGNLVTVTYISSYGNSTTEYLGYENGYYTEMKTPNYYAKYRNTFNAAKQLILREQYDQKGEGIQSYEKYEYNADGTVKSMHSSYPDANGNDDPNNVSDFTYTYNADGSLNKVRIDRTMRGYQTISEQVYVYASYDASFVPQNLKAVLGESSNAVITWDAVSGASQYIVIYDQKTDTVAANTLTTGTLLDGDHTFWVQAIVGGEAKNVSESATVAVKDMGKLPAQEFQVLSVEAGQDQWDSNCFNVAVSFTLPEGHSEIKGYKLCYGPGDYDNVTISDDNVIVEGNKVTAVASLGEWSVGTWNSNTMGYDYGEKPLSIVISYTSGLAEASNGVMWDFATNTNAIATPNTTAAPAAIYTVAGAKVNDMQRGVNIVKMTDGSVKKMIVK